MASNYYDVLNVPKDADNKAISEAYKKMALKWHPDKNPDNFDEANRQFQQISEAYQVLSDGTKRLRYDRGQSNNNRHDHDFFDNDYDDDDDDDEFGSFFGSFHFISPEMLFRHFFQQRVRGGFGAHNFFNDQHHRQNHRHDRNKNAENGRKKAEERREQMCHIRTVNGKQWKTKTYYKDDNKIVERYEDGELISKHINGVLQKI